MSRPGAERTRVCCDSVVKELDECWHPVKVGDGGGIPAQRGMTIALEEVGSVGLEISLATHAVGRIDTTGGDTRVR
jgi:hypothetical protein